MRICDNKSGLMDCGGGCYDGGLCLSKCKCEDSLTVNENMVKRLMAESGRDGKIVAKCTKMGRVPRERD